MEIPRGFEPGKTAGVLNAGVAATPGGIATSAPYRQLSAGIAQGGAALSSFVEAAKADQALDDKNAAAIAVAKVNAATVDIMSSLAEQPIIKDDDGTERRIDEWKDPNRPELGLLGNIELNKHMQPIIDEAIGTLTKDQSRIAKLAITNLMAQRGTEFQGALVAEKGARRAAEGIETIRSMEDPDERRAMAKQLYSDGAINAQSRDAADAETAKWYTNKQVGDFTSRERSDVEWTAITESIKADPHSQPEDKDHAIAQVNAFMFGRSQREDSANFEAYQAGRDIVTTARVNATLTAEMVKEVYEAGGLPYNEAAAWYSIAITPREVGGITVKDNDLTVIALQSDIDTLARVQGGNETDLHAAQDVMYGKLATAIERHQISPETAGRLGRSIADAPDERFKGESFKDAMRYVTRMITGVQADSIEELLSKITVGQEEMSRLSSAQAELKDAVRQYPDQVQHEPLAWARENIGRYLQPSQLKTLATSVVPDGSMVDGKPVYAKPDAPPDETLYSAYIDKLQRAGVIGPYQAREALNARRAWKRAFDAGVKDAPKGGVTAVAPAAPTP